MKARATKIFRQNAKAVALRLGQVAGLFVFALCAFSAQRAWAYVDPGIAAILYQALYAIAFGAVSLFVIRPWRYLRSIFSGFGRRRKPASATPPDPDVRND